MNILVVGDNDRLSECREKFGPAHEYALVSDHKDAIGLMDGDGVIFDFAIDGNPAQIDVYRNTSRVVLVNSVKSTLRKLAETSGLPLPGALFGFNGLPGFLRYPSLEVSMLPTSNRARLQDVCNTLGCDFVAVEDRVGLVSPRVVCMIINEAYYTVEDETASRGDIDLAMKLGTNYPQGPFEWCRQIGVRHVCELLDALFRETNDDRYKICSLLRDEYLNATASSSKISPV